MADFSALIAQIEAYVKQNGNNEITGNGLQSILVGMVNAIGGALNDAVADLQDEDTELTNSIGSEADAREEADNIIGELIATINGKIPSEASSSNKLADKAFVTTLTDALQSAIDTINANIGNGYVYAGVATPSGTPVSGKVVYLTAQAGTYTNYGGLVVPTGISVLKYNGTTWSQEQVMSMADIYRNPLMGLFDCSTAGAMAAKVVTADGYVLPTNGGSMKVRMANHTTVDNVTLNINGTGAKTLYYKGKAAGINNTWGDGAILNVMYDSTNSIYLAYDANAGTGDGVFDISDYTGDTYEDLVAALADVPVSERHGGMMVRFIQGSAPSVDNKYVQFRCKSDSFTTNPDEWVFEGDDVLVENPEFMKVFTDSEGKILWAIKTDGSIYYGAGVPQQVIDYINEKIAELSLDEYEDIVTFLSDLEKGDKTLRQLLNEKVDKEEEKGLIPLQYIQETENPEFEKVILDSDNKIVQGIRRDGTTFISKLDAPEMDEYKKSVEDIVEKSKKDLAEHYDYYNVSKHHTVGDYYKLFTINEGWTKIEYNAEYSMYDPEDTYQIGEICNFDTDTDNSYEATARHKGVAPATITQEYVTRTKFTLEEAIAVLPEEVLTSFAAGQKICFVDLDDFVEEWQITESGTWERISPYDINDPEGRLEVKTDADNKIVAYRKADGTWVECVGIEAPNLGDYVDKEEGKGLIDKDYAEGKYTIDDPEGRHEMVLDQDDKIVSYREPDGTLVENVGLKTPHLELIGDGLNDLEKALKNNGFHGGTGDWSDYVSNDGDNPLCLPIPKLAFLNIISDMDLTTLTKKAYSASAMKGVNYDVPTQVEFWDNQGNYLKKWTLMSAQGSSSMGYAKKNIAFDFFDSEVDGDAFKMQFGDWVPQDSFHLKAWVADFFKCLSAVSYQIAEEVAKTRGVIADTPWKRHFYSQYEFTGNLYADPQIDDMNLQMDNGAKCQPDGFPVIVFQNGEFYGIYAWMIKKHRDNYLLGKKDAKNIHLDGNFYTHHLYNGDIDWTSFEVRNPKDLYYKEAHNYKYKEGSTYKYDADDPGQFEIADSTTVDAWIAAGQLPDGSELDTKIANNTKKVHKSITDVSGRLAEIEAAGSIEAKKALIEQYFDLPSLIDYEVIQCAVVDPDSIFNNIQMITYDGVKWYACEYDKDDAWGNHNYCNMPRTEGSWTYALFSTNQIANASPIGLVRKYYQREAAQRWKELVDAGIFTRLHFMTLVRNWMARIGKTFYEMEYAKWNASNSDRDTGINTDYWKYIANEYNPSTPAYNENTAYSVGDRCSVIVSASSGSWKHILECIEPCTGQNPYTGTKNGWRGSLGQLDAFMKNNFEKENAFFEGILNNN